MMRATGYAMDSIDEWFVRLMETMREGKKVGLRGRVVAGTRRSGAERVREGTIW